VVMDNLALLGLDTLEIPVSVRADKYYYVRGTNISFFSLCQCIRNFAQHSLLLLLPKREQQC
jgi:hypothetical protein